MSDYIEREALLKHRHGCDRQCKDCDFAIEGDSWCMGELFAVDVLRLPTADVRPVITCERCVYHVDCGYHYCNKWRVNCPDNADFFCAYGEEES